MEPIYNYKTSSISCSFKDADSKKGIVTGYFSAFNNKDSDEHIIPKGAYEKTIAERGPDSPQPRIKHLLNHRSDQPLGKLITLKEDNRGLYYESAIGHHTLGREFISMVEAGLITEHSIGYRVVQKEETRDGTLLKEIQLWEGSSLTSWGANEFTPLTSLKTADRETYVNSLIDKHKAIERFVYNTDVTDETLASLILYNKQLFQSILDLTKETTEPEDSTQPDNKERGFSIWEDASLNQITNLFKNPRDGTEQEIRTIVQRTTGRFAART